MEEKMRVSLSLILALVLFASCATERGFVDFKKEGVYASEAAGNKKFEDIGPLSADVSGFAWDSCDKLATEAVRSLVDLAKARGANTVYGIKFDSKDGITTTPTCTKGYGWFALYIVGGLGPWVARSSANGVAAKLAEGAQTSDAIRIPDGADSLAVAKAYIDRVK
jgi:hypothetical protein